MMPYRQRSKELTAIRQTSFQRDTKETKVRVYLDLDGSGVCNITTGIGAFDHLLEQISRHGRVDLTIEAQGDLEVDAHHTVEDVGICMGRALDKALGDRVGITRMGHAIVPLDEALAMVALDLGGRGYAQIDAGLSTPSIGALPTELLPHFLETLAREGRMTLHARVLSGANDHHKAEAIFKALARALDAALRLDPRVTGVPSTKGSL